MSIFDLFKDQQFFKTDPKESKKKQDNLPQLFDLCNKCKDPVGKEELKKHFGVCPKCGFHHPISVQERIKHIYGNSKFEALDTDLVSNDFLNFADRKRYTDRIEKYIDGGQTQDALVNTRGKIDNQKVLIGFFNFGVLGGSMGSVVGEKVCRLFERGLDEKLPVIIFHTTGGARMQEGLMSLFQMGKTSIVLHKFRKESGVPYITVLCHPTTGGVAASFGIAGDVNLAEKDALIGFAGPRVIQQAIRKPLPEGFQTSEYVYTNGMVDTVLHRSEIKPTLVKLVKLLRKD
jgi:acetyl-CoA carboxylase carboxyl transferase subunit beta